MAEIEYDYELDGEITVRGTVLVTYRFIPSRERCGLGDDVEFLGVQVKQIRLFNSRGLKIFELSGISMPVLADDVLRLRSEEIEDLCITDGRRCLRAVEPLPNARREWWVVELFQAMRKVPPATNLPYCSIP